MDADRDGVISASELREFLQAKKGMDPERADMLLRVIDTSGSGDIHYT